MLGWRSRLAARASVWKRRALGPRAHADQLAEVVLAGQRGAEIGVVDRGLDQGYVAAAGRAMPMAVLTGCSAPGTALHAPILHHYPYLWVQLTTRSDEC
jgi:hypothetical protein